MAHLLSFGSEPGQRINGIRLPAGSFVEFDAQGRLASINKYGGTVSDERATTVRLAHRAGGHPAPSGWTGEDGPRSAASRDALLTGMRAGWEHCRIAVGVACMPICPSYPYSERVPWRTGVPVRSGVVAFARGIGRAGTDHA